RREHDALTQLALDLVEVPERSRVQHRRQAARNDLLRPLRREIVPDRESAAAHPRLHAARISRQLFLNQNLREHAGTDAARRDALWGLAETAPPAARNLLREQLLKETRPDWLASLGQYFSRVQDHEILGPLTQHWDRLPSGSRRELLRALAKAAGPSDAPIMTGLLRKAENGDQASVLAQWIAAQGLDTRSAIDFLHSRLADTPGDFSRYQEALAILGDPAVVAWAEKRIWSDPKLEDWQTPNVLALSPLPEADAAARKIIESGDTKRIESLVTAYVYTTGNPRRWDRLDDILRSQSTNASLLAELKTQLFYLRRDAPDEDKATANRLFERTREALAALPRKPLRQTP
ncbi:MAG TPA: hypothetical protein VLX28_16235, partial [Thermoanaerobaculia bacterium]|nr:hypothetical protein [Thermoanaerobaculia bacterium]